MIRARFRPSPGFVAVLLTYGLVVSFFVWALSLPDLDRIWTLQHQLKTGRLLKLAKSDRCLLENAMVRYPQLAFDLLDGKEIGLISAHNDGWIATPTVTLIRRSEARARIRLVLEVQTPLDLLPCPITIRSGSDWKKNLVAKEHGLLHVDLGGPPASDQVIEILLKGRGLLADPSILGIRVLFEEMK